jgi:hypothetical protein
MPQTRKHVTRACSASLDGSIFLPPLRGGGENLTHLVGIQAVKFSSGGLVRSPAQGTCTMIHFL